MDHKQVALELTLALLEKKSGNIGSPDKLKVAGGDVAEIYNDIYKRITNPEEEGNSQS